MRVASGRKPSFGSRFDRVPGVRGVARLAEAFAVIPLVKRALPEAKLPMQDVRTLGAMAGAAAAGRVLRRSGSRTLARETGVALISLAPAILALRQGDLASWHGVEHKAIAAYEQDGETAEASEGARPLRLQPGGADARRDGRRQRRRPQGGPQRAGRRGRGRAGEPGRGRRGLRLVGAPRGHRAREGAHGAPATRSSGWSGRGSRSEAQIEVGQAALAEILRREREARYVPGHLFVTLFAPVADN